MNVRLQTTLFEVEEAIKKMVESPRLPGEIMEDLADVIDRCVSSYNAIAEDEDENIISYGWLSDDIEDHRGRV